MAIDTIRETVDRLYKSHYGTMVSTLVGTFRNVNLETIEDAVQDAFAAALTGWEKDSMPSNPSGWIFTVGKNKVLNKIKEGKKQRYLHEEEDFKGPEPEFRESAFDDQQVALLFACAHPDLSPKVQVVITLKYVANLKVEAIAKVLGMTIDGIDKMLLRARQKIRDENILLVEPGLPHLEDRLPIVNKIIYLIFNEGYKSSSGREMIREELCEDALLINRSLLDKGMGDKATAALHALMLFNAARLKGRFGSAGELLDLEEQDRDLWDKRLIGLGYEWLEQSRGGILSTYHYEASIACLHSSARSFQATDWNLISELYQQLLAMNQNPFVELNYAIALYYSGKKEQAIDILNTLEQNPFLNQYYLLSATFGKIYLLEGEYEKAKPYFERTLAQTTLQIEKDFILKLMNRMKAN